MVHAPIARVSTGITETGQDHLPAEIEFAFPCRRKRENFVVRADREEPAAADRDRLRARFLAPINATFLPREKEFTAVQWDQRGTGKTPETTGRSSEPGRSIHRS